MHSLTTVHELESIIGTPSAAVTMKQVDALDDGCRGVLVHSPIAGFGFRDAHGAMHATLVGGSAGFARMRSPTRIAFDFTGDPAPVPGGGVSFVFLMPGVGETLRLNGAVAERSARELVIAVEEAFVHCALCIRRSGLWRPVRTPTGGPVTPVPAASPGTPSAGPRPLGAPSVARFLAASPFAVVSTRNAAGASDTSPRGDAPGFLRRLDDHTLVIPDRRGNQRTDTLHNLLSCPQIAVAAVIPGRTEVLHIAGTAFATDDAALLATMAVGGKSPQLALVIRVERADIVENHAVRASRMWQPSSHLAPDAAPDMMSLATQHLARNNQRSLKAWLFRAFSRVLGAFPATVRRLAEVVYRKQLLADGYASTADAGLAIRAVRVVEVIRETADAVSLVLEDPSGAAFAFAAGQYFTLVVDIDGEHVRRAYSAASLPGQPRLALTIKRIANGRCSSYANARIRPGAALGLLGPSGRFCIAGDATARRELVLIAGGSGITPMMSIAQTVLATEPDSHVTLLYGNRAEPDIIFAAALAALADTHGERFTLRHVLEQPPATWSGGIGPLDETTVRRELTQLARSNHAHYFVCGPAPMRRGVRDALAGFGVASERIHEERFSSPAVPRGRVRGRERAQRMTVEQGGVNLGEVDVSAGQTLLEAGLQAGLALPFSCAMGNCGECRVALRSGDVELDEPNTLTPAERARGCILTCVARPRSPVAIEIEREARDDEGHAGKGGSER